MYDRAIWAVEGGVKCADVIDLRYRSGVWLYPKSA